MRIKPEHASQNLLEMRATYNGRRKNLKRRLVAEGLTRLYAVEEVARRYDGHFLHLDVGPATARSVRIRGEFTFGVAMGARKESVNIEGSVSLG